ncbi:hypothetical protein NC653_018818 [Populus alba x Populus x berolinensis]|uniref:Uncharacterized protein n=1 Tax=Populus alba x Populus x berolinensis TaxID=444605 RepID=A0AAD6QHA0_9ROSI|nr:hypothetical protein NC653_018818 [Populus alba x Populus x berolinensis]
MKRRTSPSSNGWDFIPNIDGWDDELMGRKKKENRKRKENREKREKKDKKKRERGRAEKAIRRILSKARKNTEARATTPPAQHAFIAIIFFISRKHQQKERKRTETKTGVASLFRCPEKQQPLVERRSFSTCHLRPSQHQHSRKGKKNRGREREEKKTGRRKEKEASNTGERQTNAGNGGPKKNGIASRPANSQQPQHPLRHGAKLEAPPTIFAVIALTICSIKAGSKNGIDPVTGSTSGGILSPPCLSDTSSMDIFA